MASKTTAEEPIQGLNPYQWIRLVTVYVLIPAVLFICAWDLAWWQAWVYSVLILLAGIGGHAWAERRHPGLLAERVYVEEAPGVKPWDRLLAPLVGLGTSFLLVIPAGLDHRFGWSPAFPASLNILGFILIAAGYALAAWASAENRFFSSMVRIQAERGHVVCDSGPYRLVRHPGYAGLVLSLPGIVLALSSTWTIIPAAATLIAIVIRTALEDRVLMEELAGYREYARSVRYRLVPWIY